MPFFGESLVFAHFTSLHILTLNFVPFSSVPLSTFFMFSFASVKDNTVRPSGLLCFSFHIHSSHLLPLFFCLILFLRVVPNTCLFYYLI